MSEHVSKRPRLYGRQVAHGGLKEWQRDLLETALPSISLEDVGTRLNPVSCFTDVSSVHLEIGFGAGEHLVWQAEQNPDIGFIGIEPFQTGVASCLKKIASSKLNNIRLCMGDARRLLDRLSAQSLSRVYILHPDPWPKWRHAKRRIVGPALIEQLALLMPRDGEVRIGTDWADYSTWTLRHMLASDAFKWNAECADDWRVRPADWPETRYAQKAAKEGRRDVHLEFIRV